MTHSVWLKAISIKEQFRITVLVTRYRGKNIKLNPKKLQLGKLEARCIVHLLTPDSLNPDLNKVKAILGMPTPVDKQSLKRLLVIIPYLRTPV